MWRFWEQHGCMLVRAESNIWATSAGGYCLSVQVCTLQENYTQYSSKDVNDKPEILNLCWGKIVKMTAASSGNGWERSNQ